MRPAHRAVDALLIFMLVAVSVSGCKPAHQWNGEPVEPLESAPELVGTNWDGETFRLSDLEGKVAVVFFGYTFCPDVCPFTLYKMKQLYKELGDRAEDLAMVFVSVDPHRDTLEKMAEYVPGFDPRFYGVRLEHDELQDLQEPWDITVQYSQPKEGPGTDSYYYVDHTGTYFVIDRVGRLRLTFPPNAKAEDLLPDLEVLLGE